LGLYYYIVVVHGWSKRREGGCPKQQSMKKIQMGEKEASEIAENTTLVNTYIPLTLRK
jgi:hypothetical protein